MEITLATVQNLAAVQKYDRHIPENRLRHCIQEGRVFVLLDAGAVLGVLRYSLFWQTIPFLDLIYLDEALRGLGFGRRMMAHWENAMASQGCRHVMLSTQADEAAQFFYEKLGYRRIGAFLPPDQEAEELMYLKEV